MSVVADHTTAPHHDWADADQLKTVWRDTCDGLSIEVDADTGPTFAHDVAIGLVADPDGGVRTQYRVALDAAVTAKFSLTKKSAGDIKSTMVTGDERFDQVVAVETDDAHVLNQFLTAERRSVIVQLMQRMPQARVTHKSVCTWSQGMGRDQGQTERNIDRLIEVARAVRPSWFDVALDERSVLHDLFARELDQNALVDRFNCLYLGHEVNWTGELLQLGATDRVGQRAAVLVGSADGQTSESGRVVALTALDPKVRVEPGDVVPISGSLWNLDARKRMFHIE